MKKILLLLLLPMLSYPILVAQSGAGQKIGIGVANPKATLHIEGTFEQSGIPDGLIAPRLTGNQLTAKNAQYGPDQQGAIVYVTAPASSIAGKTMYVKSVGYYYYNSTANNGVGVWESLSTQFKRQFYLPTMFLPTDMYTMPDSPNYSSNGSVFTVDLFNEYKLQISTTIKSNPKAKPDYFDSPTSYNYYVLYYDSNVFTSVTINTQGILTYRLVSAYLLSDKSYMTIMIQEK